ncbi:hypothetical protein F4819DRAFT_506127 [Hypoxylon fuscum]|nr:hypothetical protein F4819DRAFT_506127 [Hypoxylon fuscum]
MENLQFFAPSEQLTGGAYVNRKGNGNYRGDINLPVNRGTHVPEQANTSLWITGLPGSTTISDLLGSITNVGRVRSVVVNPPNETTSSAAATISFFHRHDAETLHRIIQQGRIMVGGRFPKSQWNRNRVGGEEDSSGQASRVVLIAGEPDVVNEQFLNYYFSKKFVYDIDTVIDHGTVSAFGGPISRLEYRFGSWRGQAIFAKMALTKELPGFTLAEYGEDPCAV